MRLGLGLGLPPGGGRVFQAESLLIFAAFTTAPSGSRKSSIDNAVAALKNGGVWSKLDALWMFAAAASQAALINWKDPGTFDATLVNSPIFTADRGFTTNGSDSYVDTNFNPATAGGNFAQDTAMFGTWRGDDGLGVTGGWFDATDGTTIGPKGANNRIDFRINQAGTSNTANGSVTDARGWTTANRSASNATQTYKNGVDVAVTAGGNAASTALNSNNFFLGRHGLASFVAVDVRAAAVASSLSAAEHASFYDALSAYMTDVGAG